MPAAVHRGEIWWADVPGDTVRPVLVLTRERFISRLSSVLVAPLTSTVRSIPTEVAFGPAEGLPRRCAANFDNVFTLRKERLQDRITRVAPTRWPAICEAHRFSIGC